jgi:hypothetical protein
MRIWSSNLKFHIGRFFCSKKEVSLYMNLLILALSSVVKRIKICNVHVIIYQWESGFMIELNRCPGCGEYLIEDAWEEVHMDEKDDSILVESFPALICKVKCGFYERVEGEVCED